MREPLAAVPTLDAIARESGLSKGGVMHQFRTKQAVLRALLERQIAHFKEFTSRYMEKARETSAQPELTAQIATVREASMQPNSAALSLLAAIVEDPNLMALPREVDGGTVRAIKAEASDPDLALLRWTAARGLLLSELLGMSPLSKAEHQRLFDRLLDDSQWSALEKRSKPRAVKAGAASSAKTATARKRA